LRPCHVWRKGDNDLGSYCRPTSRCFAVAMGLDRHLVDLPAVSSAGRRSRAFVARSCRVPR
jgi:hypothetical protein